MHRPESDLPAATPPCGDLDAAAASPAPHADAAAVARLIAPCARDIRTPVASLLAASEILVEEMEPTHPCAGYARLIREVSSRLSGAMLDLAALALPMSLHVRVFDLNAFTREYLDRRRQWANRRGVWFATRLPDEAHLVSSDPDALAVVFTRLLTHQVTAMAAGGALEVALARGGARGVRLAFSDSGPTVAPHLLTRVFDPCFSSAGRHAGLALALVKRILEQQGDTVAARANRYGGLTVELCLRAPVEPACAEPWKGPFHELHEAQRN